MVRYFQKRPSLTYFFLVTQNSKISRFKAKCRNFKVNYSIFLSQIRQSIRHISKKLVKTAMIKNNVRLILFDGSLKLLKMRMSKSENDS